MNEVPIGSIVILRSGGPAMTVEIITRADGLVECKWFVNDELKRDAFDINCIIRII